MLYLNMKVGSVMSNLDQIVQFNKDKNLNVFNSFNEYDMLAKELQEFLEASQLPDEENQAEELADIIIIAVGAIHKLGYNPSQVLEEKIKVINSRKGGLNDITGKWEKDRSQDPDTLYKAAYQKYKE